MNGCWSFKESWTTVLDQIKSSTSRKLISRLSEGQASLACSCAISQINLGSLSNSMVYNKSMEHWISRREYSPLVAQMPFKPYSKNNLSFCLLGIGRMGDMQDFKASQQLICLLWQYVLRNLCHQGSFGPGSWRPLKKQGQSFPQACKQQSRQQKFPSLLQPNGRSASIC